MSTEPTPTASLLDQLRSRIQELSEQAVQERDELRGERDQLLDEKKRLTMEKQQLRSALDHVFPYETLKEKRTDLSEFDNNKLIDHFIRHGINEKTDLRHEPMKRQLEDCQKDNRKLQKESALIRQELSKAQIHMELLKELIMEAKAQT